MMRHDGMSRLFDVIEQHRNRAFSWHGNHCGLFAARCHDAMHGTDIESQILATLDEPRAVVDLAAAVSAYIGEPVNARAVRGDVVTVDDGEGEVLGVCMGSKVVCMGVDGLRYLPRAAIKRVWKWAR